MNRILLVIDTLNSGGAERQLAGLALELKKNNQEIILCTFYKCDTSFYNDYLTSQGVNVQCLGGGKNPFKKVKNLKKIIKNFSPSLVIAYKDGSAMAACLAKIVSKNKYILAVSERNTTQKLKLKTKIKYQLYRKADYVLPNSNMEANLIKVVAPFLKHKVRVISNMLDLEKFYYQTPNITEKECPTVITAARVVPQKNPLLYLEAISLLKSRGVKAKFKWFGDNPLHGYEKLVIAKKEELGLTDEDIEFLPATKNITEEYHNADIFCLPSLWEGFPNVVCEAIASGIFTIASNVSDTIYIVRDTKRVFDPTNLEQMANCLQYAIENGYKNYNDSFEESERIKEMCSPTTFYKKYISLLS